MTKYKAAANNRQSNDCGVYALSRLLNIEYGEARVRLFHWGYSSTKGVQARLLIHCLNKAGVQLELFPLEETVRAGDLSLPHRNGLVLVQGHVMPLIDGKIENFQKTEGFRVQSVWLIGKNEELPSKGRG